MSYRNFVIIILEEQTQSFSLEIQPFKKSPSEMAVSFCVKKGNVMAKIDELTLEVKLEVSDEMAVACVAILNLYLKDNDVVDVMGEKIDGHYQIHLVNKATTGE